MEDKPMEIFGSQLNQLQKKCIIPKEAVHPLDNSRNYDNPISSPNQMTCAGVQK